MWLDSRAPPLVYRSRQGEGGVAARWTLRTGLALDFGGVSFLLSGSSASLGAKKMCSGRQELPRLLFTSVAGEKVKRDSASLVACRGSIRLMSNHRDDTQRSCGLRFDAKEAEVGRNTRGRLGSDRVTCATPLHQQG